LTGKKKPPSPKGLMVKLLNTLQAGIFAYPLLASKLLVVSAID
jgi:hypothetical protein